MANIGERNDIEWEKTNRGGSEPIINPEESRIVRGIEEFSEIVLERRTKPRLMC